MIASIMSKGVNPLLLIIYLYQKSWLVSDDDTLLIKFVSEKLSSPDNGFMERSGDQVPYVCSSPTDEVHTSLMLHNLHRVNCIWCSWAQWWIWKVNMQLEFFCFGCSSYSRVKWRNEIVWDEKIDVSIRNL